MPVFCLGTRKTVHIALAIAALQALKVMAANIMNAFTSVPNKENIWMTPHPKFGKKNGYKNMNFTALYGLKATFQSHLTVCTRHLGYDSNRANPNL